MTTSDEWIQTRTGIRERRYADEGVKCSDLALKACRRALNVTQMTPADIDFLILGTLSSNALDFSDRGRDVSVLFGDGAAAVVLSPSLVSQRGVHVRGRAAAHLGRGW